MEEWGKLSSGSQSGKVHELVLDVQFWQNVENLVHLFSHAIHQLEGDKPHLAECHHVLIVLRKHFEDWAKKHKDKMRRDRPGSCHDRP
jgi:hypothetical protein